jgi:hypothetical protein
VNNSDTSLLFAFGEKFSENFQKEIEDHPRGEVVKFI